MSMTDSSVVSPSTSPAIVKLRGYLNPKIAAMKQKPFFSKLSKSVEGTMFASWKTWAIIVVAVILIIWMIYYRNKHVEGLEIVPGFKEHSTEGTPENIQISPTDMDSEKHIIQSGPEYSPNPLMSPWYQAYTGNQQNYYLLDDGESGTAGLHFNQCSKSCCSDQYPLPFKMPAETSVCNNKDAFVPNDYTCNNAWQDSGCVCMTKDQSNFLGSRGGNA